MTNCTPLTSALPRTGSQDVLNAIEEKLGFVPNLFSALAQQPGVVESFVALDGAFSEASLTAIERQTILLAASVANSGSYCVAGHSIFGRSIGMPKQAISAIRSGGKVEDERLSALQTFVTQLIQHRGHVTREDINELARHGFSREQTLEIIMGVTLKTFSNYVDSAMQLTLDEQFETASWSEARAATG
jgi:uncharacterized peroxidase-related enzyme